MCILLFIGIYFPTSRNGEILKTLTYTQFFILALIYLYFIKIQKSIDLKFIINFIIINIILLYGTLFSNAFLSIDSINIGALLSLELLSIMYMIDFKKINLEINIKKAFYICNIINLVFIYLIIFSNDLVKEFFINNYSIFYDELVSNMFINNKPVLTFGTHSIAGFYMFLFIIVSYITYKYTLDKINILIIVLYIIALFNLKSNTSYIYFIIFIIILIKDIKLNDKMIINIYLIIFVLLIYIIFNKDILINLKDNITMVFGSKNNGLMSRIGSSGVLKTNLEYIKNNFFIPIGIGYNSNLFFEDSGIIVTMLRGGIVLLISNYCGLYSFLKNNIINKNYLLYLTISILIFEVGFNNLVFIRSLYLIPFFIGYINYLEDKYT